MTMHHLHLMLNHAPIAGIPIGGLIFIIGLWKAHEVITKTGASILLVVGLLAIPTYLTGEPAEHAVQKLSGVAQEIIEAHEQAGQFALTYALVVATLCALYLFVEALQPKVKILRVAILLVWLLSVTTIARTGYLGGQIRRAELRDAAQ